MGVGFTGPHRGPDQGVGCGGRTVEELGTLDEAALHLLTLVGRRFHVTDGGGEDGGA